MCLQCCTNMLTVGRVENTDSHDKFSGHFFGIARKNYEPEEIREGDVLIGRVNDPSFVISDGLFTKEEWEKDRDNCLKGDMIRDFEWDDGDIFLSDPATWWRTVPHSIRRFEENFGECPEEMLSCWTSYVVTTAAELFQRRNIPLNRGGRYEWACQFPDKIEAVRLKDRTDSGPVFDVYQYVETDDGSYECQTVTWDPSEVDYPSEVLD